MVGFREMGGNVGCCILCAQEESEMSIKYGIPDLHDPTSAWNEVNLVRKAIVQKYKLLGPKLRSSCLASPEVLTPKALCQSTMLPISFHSK